MNQQIMQNAFFKHKFNPTAHNLMNVYQNSCKVDCMSKKKIDQFNQDLKFNQQMGFYASLDFDSSEVLGNKNLEIDYEWDFLSDPLITPTIIHEWEYLDVLMGKHVTSDAEFVLSVGGGGNSRTHLHLSSRAKTLIVLNPGLWDLTNYPDTFGELQIVKVRGIAENLPFETKSISAIEIPSTLDHVFDPKKVIVEAFRVLDSGGKIGITLGNEHSWYRNTFRFFRIQIDDHHEHAHSFHFKPTDIENLLQDAGFKNIRTIGTAYLKLPKFLERRISGRRSLAFHRFMSNRFMSALLSKHLGGMYLVIAEKNS
jgi:SAM-dependent methyltransferase